MRIFGIRGAVGLLLTILILKFLLSGPFNAFEHLLVTFFTALEQIPNAALTLKARVPEMQLFPIIKDR